MIKQWAPVYLVTGDASTVEKNLRQDPNIWNILSFIQERNYSPVADVAWNSYIDVQLEHILWNVVEPL